jgi:hypothetical protein
MTVPNGTELEIEAEGQDVSLNVIDYPLVDPLGIF